MTDRTAQRAPSSADSSQVSEIRLPSFALPIYIAVFLLVWSLRATVFIHIDESIESAAWRNVYSNVVKFAVWVLPALITLRVWGLRPLIYTKLTTRLDKRGSILGAIVAVVWLSLVVLVAAVLSHRSVETILLQPEWLSILIGVFFSPICEEILFRGFFLNQLNESFSFRKSSVLSALLFMLVHWPYWVSKFGFSAGVIKDSINVVLLGCLFGWLMKKSNSLWPAIGMHIANNFLSGLIHA